MPAPQNNVLAAIAEEAYRPSAENSTLPEGWTRDNSITGEGRGPGFDASVFYNGNEVVISFRGTDGAALASASIDFWYANIPAARGSYSDQVRRAIEVVADVMAAHAGKNIALTGIRFPATFEFTARPNRSVDGLRPSSAVHRCVTHGRPALRALPRVPGVPGTWGERGRARAIDVDSMRTRRVEPCEPRS